MDLLLLRLLLLLSLFHQSYPLSAPATLPRPSRENTDALFSSFVTGADLKAPIVNGKYHKTAVILNTNARSVSDDLIPIAQEVFGEDHVYVTTTADEAQESARRLLQQNVSLILPVGGDGTVTSMMNYLCQAILQSDTDECQTLEDAMKRLPAVGYIPMGTGNGLGSVVGFPTQFAFRKRHKLRHFKAALETFRRVGQSMHTEEGDVPWVGTTHVDVIDLPMMELSYESPKKQSDLCFFTGVGFDSLMLQDFQTIKDWAKRKNFLPRMLSSVTGYTVALLTRTLPQCVARGAHRVKVEVSSPPATTTSSSTLWVDHRRGDLVRKVDPQDPLLFKGTAGILAASTTPYYGGGLRLFPFARMHKDKMHVRIGRIHPLRGFLNIPRIFAGSYRDKRDAAFGCLDFLGSEFEIKVTNPTKGYPLQHSGESVGMIQRFRLKVLKHPVRFVTIMSKRRVRYD